MFQQLTGQLIHDLKASWKKTALLGVLLAVGLCFWIPLLIRTVSGGSRESGIAEPVAAAIDLAVAARPSTPNDPSPGQNVAPEFHWAVAAKLFQTDPLLQSADVMAVDRDPFQIDATQFPLPVQTVDATHPADEVPTKGTSSASPQPLDGAVLKSTVIGPSRRAAFINSRLYYEGRSLNLGDETYHVAAIYPRRVVLRRGQKVYELSIETQSHLDETSVRAVD